VKNARNLKRGLAEGSSEKEKRKKKKDSLSSSLLGPTKQKKKNKNKKKTKKTQPKTTTRGSSHICKKSKEGNEEKDFNFYLSLGPDSITNPKQSNNFKEKTEGSEGSKAFPNRPGKGAQQQKKKKKKKKTHQTNYASTIGDAYAKKNNRVVEKGIRIAGLAKFSRHRSRKGMRGNVPLGSGGGSK